MEEILNAITWHQLAFVFAVVFILVFRQPIAGLIKRTTRIDKGGLTAESSLENQREEIETGAEAVQQLLDAVGNSIVINEQEERIKNDLRSRGLSSGGSTDKVLIRHLAGTQLLLAFERIHSSIFGSQINLLRYLNEVTGQGRSAEKISDYFAKVRELYPNQLGDWSIEQYLHFLYSQLLIIRQTEQMHITNLGVEYLVWIARNGRSDDRYL